MPRDPSPTLFASSNGIELVYDCFGDLAAPPLLLIMGLGTQMIACGEAFLRAPRHTRLPCHPL